MGFDINSFAISGCIVFSLLIVRAASRDMEECPSFCRYRHCYNLFRDGNHAFEGNYFQFLGIPNLPLSPFPCIPRPGGIIQELRNVTGGEARVSKFFENDFKPISKFMREEVHPNFRSNQVKWVLNGENNRSSLTRIQSRGNQELNLHRLCVQMPITSFLTRRGVRRRTRGKSACVGFRAFVPKLLVQFRWETSNDFDLRVEEPNGFEINRFGESMVSPNGGRLTADTGMKLCQTELLKEEVVYYQRSKVEEGTYKIRVDLNRRCQPSTPYKLTVLYMGRIILSEKGTLHTEVMSDVLESSFTI